MKLLTIFCVVFLLSPNVALNHFDYLKDLFDSIRLRLDAIIDESNITANCSSDLKLYVSDLYDLKPWALKMFDATGKVAPGYAYGNQHQIGNYDECLSIKEEHIAGQYCLLVLVWKEDFEILYMRHLAVFMEYPNLSYLADSYFENFYTFWDVCVPNSCSGDDLNNVWAHINRTYEMPFVALTENGRCVSEGKTVLEPYQTDSLIFVFFGMILLVAISSTIYDIYLQKTRPKPTVFVTFSLYTNAKNLFSTRCNDDNLTCLNGIKAINMIWIVVGHMVFLKSLAGNNHPVHFGLYWRVALISAVVLATPFAVDVFFVLSGLLVVYVYLKRTETSKINLLSFYLHRYFRLMPALLGVLLFHAGVFKYLPAGIRSPQVVQFISGNCRYGWWHLLTFTLNWAKKGDLCVDQAWYLSVDTQLYVLAPIVLFNVRRHPRKILMFMVVASIISFCVVFYRVFKYQLGFLSVFELHDDLNTIYNSVFLRLPSWFLGTFYGYLIYSHRNNRIKLCKISNAILWIVSLATMLGLIMYHSKYAREKEYNPIRSAVMQTFGRFFWCFSVCNLIYSLSTGHGRFINTFLSHPVFVVLAKLSYCIYLVEMSVIYWLLSYSRQSRYFTNFQIFYEFWGDFVIILLAAATLHLLFEMPFALLMQRGRWKLNKED